MMDERTRKALIDGAVEVGLAELDAALAEPGAPTMAELQETLNRLQPADFVMFCKWCGVEIDEEDVALVVMTLGVYDGRCCSCLTDDDGNVIVDGD